MELQGGGRDSKASLQLFRQTTDEMSLFSSMGSVGGEKEYVLSLHGLVYGSELDGLMRFFIPEWLGLAASEYTRGEADLLSSMKRCRVSPWLVHEQKYRAVGFTDNSKGDMRARKTVAPVHFTAHEHRDAALEMALTQGSREIAALLDREREKNWNTGQWALAMIKVASKMASTFSCLVENVQSVHISDNFQSFLDFLGYSMEFEFVKKGFKCMWEGGVSVLIYQLYKWQDSESESKAASSSSSELHNHHGSRKLVHVDSIGDAWIVQLSAESEQRGLKDAEGVVRGLAKKLEAATGVVLMDQTSSFV
jgi:hypothetical protein